MAIKIIPKKSTVADKVPTTDDLDAGEICVNWADQVIWGRHPGNNNIVPLGGEITIEQIGGGSTAYLVQSAFASPYHYIGRAPLDTDTTDSGWDIARIEIASDGSTTTLNATGAWTDRATLSYS